MFSLLLVIDLLLIFYQLRNVLVYVVEKIISSKIRSNLIFHALKLVAPSNLSSTLKLVFMTLTLTSQTLTLTRHMFTLTQKSNIYVFDG
jgi:hypothetical protein